MRIVCRRELPIRNEDDVVIVRSAVRSLAEERGFDPFATAALTTATSELARNAWVHARGGSVDIEELDNEGRVGVRVAVRDAGPGIADLDRALKGGYSTGRSLGFGLSGSRRLVDEFTIDTAPEKGTRVTITKWMRI
jgi:serine/threonine-protein kinase RsbT